MKLKHAETAVLLALAITMLVATAFSSRQTELSNKLVRLHVVANSDTDADQSLKLAVRDAVLDTLAEPMRAATTRDEGLRIINDHMGDILAAAQRVIADAGYGYTVSATLTSEDFPTRLYEHFTLPAGAYESLRVTIGDGAGRNWWCVVYPPLCREIAVAEEVEEAFSELDEDEIRLITEDIDSGDTKVKFRIFEIIGKIKRFFGK
ncbi:MAG: stage II sporulation protein R [Oscillospiraceae bacterium]|jgi:stage II sporulation protein R|nr:stage II sporulation protein R [Oscillospiraceae bacterium]